MPGSYRTGLRDPGTNIPSVINDEGSLRLPQSGAAIATLLDAVLSVGRNLDLTEVLSRIVQSACDMVGARYGALGVLRPDGQGLMEFVTTGLSLAEAEAIGAQPRGIGVLDLLTNECRSLRLPDIASHPASTGFPPGHPRMTSFLGAPIRIRGQVFGNLYLTDKIGGPEFTDDDEALVAALAVAAGMAIDNARLFETTRRQQQWSEALGATSQALLSGLDQRQALAQLAERACAAAEAGLAVIALKGRDGSLVIEAATGPDPQASVVLGTTLTDPHWFTILASAEPLLLLSKHGESAADPPAGVLRASTGLAQHGRTAVVPMTVRPGTEAIGLLIVGWDQPETHVPYDVAEPLKQFADQAAVTLVAGYAQRDRARMTVLEDRERIARDMHDVVIQRLFATGLGLQSAARVAEEGYVRVRINEAVDQLDLAVRDIRETIFELHHAQATPFPQQVLELAAGFAGPLGFTPQVEFDGQLDRVEVQLGLDVLAVVREALSNVARHARAGWVGVRLGVETDSVWVAVEDDGAGFTETGRRSGLANLDRRAHLRGGAFEVRRAGQRGTRLIWRVPRLTPDT